jgi:hypothetical protein
MSDKDLNKFLCNMSRKKTIFCMKCGNEIIIDRHTISVTKPDDYSAKKLCCLCQNCYIDMLENLGIGDID